MLSAISYFIAAVPPSDFIANWFWVAASVLASIAIVLNMRRKPPIEAEFISRAEFATLQSQVKDELDSMRLKLDQSFQTILDRLDSVRADIELANQRRAQEIFNRLRSTEDLVSRIDERTHLYLGTPVHPTSH